MGREAGCPTRSRAPPRALGLSTVPSPESACPRPTTCGIYRASEAPVFASSAPVAVHLRLLVPARRQTHVLRVRSAAEIRTALVAKVADGEIRSPRTRSHVRSAAEIRTALAAKVADGEIRSRARTCAPRLRSATTHVRARSRVGSAAARRRIGDDDDVIALRAHPPPRASFRSLVSGSSTARAPDRARSMSDPCASGRHGTIPSRIPSAVRFPGRRDRRSPRDREGRASAGRAGGCEAVRPDDHVPHVHDRDAAGARTLQVRQVRLPRFLLLLI